MREILYVLLRSCSYRLQYPAANFGVGREILDGESLASTCQISYEWLVTSKGTEDKNPG